MPGKRQRHPSTKIKVRSHTRDQETIQIINDCLQQQPVDLRQLRRLSAVRGLVNDEVRARVWPLLLGLGKLARKSDYQYWSTQLHKDARTVDCDIQRSLWKETKGWSEERRESKRQELQRVLTAAIAEQAHEGVHYYQGLHEVAGVLLLAVGERPAHHILAHLVSSQLRDCTRASIAPVQELLPLVWPILRHADPELHDHLLQGLPNMGAMFAISWFMTWFARPIEDHGQVARLFDLFMAAHPLMPLYVAAVALRSHRTELLAKVNDEDDEPMLHSALSKLSPTLHLSTDELAAQAVRLYRTCPSPKRMAAQERLSLAHTSTPDASIRDGYWHVPAKPPPQPLLSALTRPLQLLGSAVRAAKPPRSRGQVVTALVSVSSLAAISLGAFLLANSQHGMQRWQLTGL